MVQRILELMNEKKVNAKTLTTDIGLSSSAITEWKKGKAKPSVEALEKIANYFDVSVDYLLRITDIKKPLIKGDEELTEYLSELESREELRMLFRLTSKATKEDVEKAVRVVEAMLKDTELSKIK
ncbi:MAG: helix-turn-helix transcriptional regulator [Ruminococcaceae bacterium]|nr:helix-turn-helix transcriptional regulator [Oscillospiraceae bacterium]